MLPSVYTLSERLFALRSRCSWRGQLVITVSTPAREELSERPSASTRRKIEVMMLLVACPVPRGESISSGTLEYKAWHGLPERFILDVRGTVETRATTTTVKFSMPRSLWESPLPDGRSAGPPKWLHLIFVDHARERHIATRGFIHELTGDLPALFACANFCLPCPMPMPKRRSFPWSRPCARGCRWC